MGAEGLLLWRWKFISMPEAVCIEKYKCTSTSFSSFWKSKIWCPKSDWRGNQRTRVIERIGGQSSGKNFLEHTRVMNMSVCSPVLATMLRTWKTLCKYLLNLWMNQSSGKEAITQPPSDPPGDRAQRNLANPEVWGEERPGHSEHSSRGLGPTSPSVSSSWERETLASRVLQK